MAFNKLAKIYRQNKRLYLWDFDGYDHVSMGRSLQQVRIHPYNSHTMSSSPARAEANVPTHAQVLDDPNKKMGHAFVLLMLLRGERLWETNDIPEYMSPIPQPPVSALV